MDQKSKWYEKLPKFKIPIKEKEFFDKWIEALRSGEYEQDVATLNSGEGFCCLGVAGVCAGISEEALIEQDTLSGLYFEIEGLDNVPDILKTNTDLEEILMSLNDSTFIFDQLQEYSLKKRQYSFEEIAEYLEYAVSYKEI